MAESITIDREVLQAVFDAAVNSMDFCSGFLDAEEVTMLRRCAIVLGVEPSEATPDNVLCQFEGHRIEANAEEIGRGMGGGIPLAPGYVWCFRCRRSMSADELARQEALRQDRLTIESNMT